MILLLSSVACVILVEIYLASRESKILPCKMTELPDVLVLVLDS